MKIIINAASIFKGGAEQVAHSFITECVRYPEHRFHVFLRKNIRSQLTPDNLPGHIQLYDIPFRPGTSLWHVYKAIRLFDEMAKKIEPDAVISTGGHGFWKPDIPVVGGFNIPHYVYPESPYFKMIGLKRKVYWKLKKTFDLYFYRRLDAVVVQTEDVKQRLQKLMPEVPIHAVSNTVNAVFFDENEQESGLPPKKEWEFRLLTLSANYPHKNLSVIHDVIRELKRRGQDQIRFVLTLPHEVYDTFKQPDTESQIINRGPVPIGQCPALYRDCDAMFLPTLLECFSASYAEAMKMERPILTSDLGFAHTVCGDAAHYFDPLNAAEIADRVEEVAADEGLRKKLVEAGLEMFKTLKTPAERADSFIRIAAELAGKEKAKTVETN
ncbi:glycosyltransferase [Rhodohalobacter sp.]|uniref:glycosyltransferase family 4 protein n=1 Tax=Rhodohalobacter sp. TaxID=1974210 RepID=UPI002ACD9E04|nr:glycosyltransferase [Rhodohalobacter sp.]MDZ7755201.1 glycosyltransferase [Rhodohalobacter sp.]